MRFLVIAVLAAAIDLGFGHLAAQNAGGLNVNVPFLGSLSVGGAGKLAIGPTSSVSTGAGLGSSLSPLSSSSGVVSGGGSGVTVTGLSGGSGFAGSAVGSHAALGGAPTVLGGNRHGSSALGGIVGGSSGSMTRTWSSTSAQSGSIYGAGGPGMGISSGGSGAGSVGLGGATLGVGGIGLTGT
ncbi:hypothetical protein MTO96_042908, partial [Rhipicephalus appendiculatus]